VPPVGIGAHRDVGQPGGPSWPAWTLTGYGTGCSPAVSRSPPASRSYAPWPSGSPPEATRAEAAGRDISLRQVAKAESLVVCLDGGSKPTMMQ